MFSLIIRYYSLLFVIIRYYLGEYNYILGAMSMLDGLFEYFFEHYSILNDKQRKKIKGLTTVFLVFGFCVLFGFVSMMMSHRDTEKARWEKNLSGVELYKADMLPISQNATKVLTGTYVETIDNLDMAHGNYWVKFLVWFRWDGDEISDLAHNFRIYRGIIKNRDIVKDVKQDNTHYQLVRVDVSFRPVSTASYSR